MSPAASTPFLGRKRLSLTFLSTALLVSAGLTAIPAEARQSPDAAAVLGQIWTEGTENSHVYELGQVLTDVIGPRVTGTSGFDAARHFLEEHYTRWGIEVDQQAYGSWQGWESGLTHLDLLEPRRSSLGAWPLAWSGGTDGPIEGPVVTLPDVSTREEFDRWLADVVPGAFVLFTFPQPTCRPDAEWQQHATPESLQAMQVDRDLRRQNWQGRMSAAGVAPGQIPSLIEDAGAAGILSSEWAGSWGTSRVFNAWTIGMPSLEVECEDYGLLARLAENGQEPRVRVNLEARFTGEVPKFNTIARIPGTERPDEYILLSAHLDTWGGATGATDNGTGTITMMEAMRILQEVYPNPRRTILVGHWNAEEQGLNGSQAFAMDNPQVIEGMQISLNQDNGTGRISDIGMQGFTAAGAYFQRWLEQIPTDLSRHINLDIPSLPDEGRSDHASFVCHGVPAFRLGAYEWDYRDYTWHTNRDTFDKIVIEEVTGNAVLTAMLVYLASEEPELVPRDRRTLPISPNTGEAMSWPTCRIPRRSGP